MKFVVIAAVLFFGSVFVEPAKVSIYYESLCGDSVRFIVNQLYPAYYNFSSAIEVDFVPYGKANHTLVDGTWQFECQHGEQECFGNKYQACALSQNYSQDVKVEFVTCVMNQSNPAAFVTIYNCATLHGMAFDPINQCFTDGTGDLLLAALGDRTHRIEYTQVFVPTVVYDDAFDRTLQDLSLVDFEAALCRSLAEDLREAHCAAVAEGGAGAREAAGLGVLVGLVVGQVLAEVRV